MNNEEGTMYYRVTKVTHNEDARPKMLAILDAKNELLQDFDGLHYVKMVALSDTETLAISEYETEAHLQAVETRFRELMMEMMPLMAGPPEVLSGAEFWCFTRD